jgi:hypothetical protein
MAARTALNTILRDAAKTPLLTGERFAFVPGMTSVIALQALQHEAEARSG